MLGLSIDLAVDNVDADGFVSDNDAGLSSSPVPFLVFLMSTIRRNGEGITRTHMGRVLRGHILSEEEFRAEDANNDVDITRW